MAKAGLLYPFEIPPGNHEEVLKPASCGIRVLGRIVFWEEGEKPDQPQRCTRDLRRGEVFTLARNSIVYVTLEPELRLPNYIAARFNLTIRDVYRGLLVGTGPLVDPGFCGNLSLPIHNLTSNEYTITGGEVLLWMEFTKLSPHPEWDPSVKRNGRPGALVEFPGYKKERRRVDDYLARASSYPIRSSIPVLVERTTKAAEDSASEARRLRTVSLVGLLAAVAAIAALVLASYQLLNDVVGGQEAARRDDPTLSQGVRNDIQDLRTRVQELERAAPRTQPSQR